MLIAVWAVVLVPMWAHRQSPPAASETSPGARVITRRSPAREGRWPPHWLPHWLLPRPLRARPGGRPTLPRTSARAAILKRRRITLAAVTGVLLLTVAAVLLGLLPSLLLVTTAPYVGYLVWLRATAVAAAAHRQALRRTAAEQRAAGFRDFDAAPELVTVSDSADASSSASFSSPMPAQMPASMPAATPADPSTAPWLPVALPLPSYVTAAPAPTVIDGDWHEEALLEGELPGEAAAYALGEEILRRPAVGD